MNSNTIRHLNAKAKHVIDLYNEGNIQYHAIQDLMCSIFNEIDYQCDCCSHEDFGYCDLRSSSMNMMHRYLKFCIPAFIKWSDNEIMGVDYEKSLDNRCISK